ncbi:hypothetical protein ACFQ3W_03700 [Paenibacillus puldeungensis]|uniref:Uncharacterized protein n=1 Tax=Paenibacillus puldeungensis TaxID=696536 RepID=A0ABW3RSZ8_9BACL
MSRNHEPLISYLGLFGEDAYVKPTIELHYDYFKIPIFTEEDMMEEIGRANCILCS